MDTCLLTPHADDRCASCGELIFPDKEAVLVPDEAGEAFWWHMRCRDRVIPQLTGEYSRC